MLYNELIGIELENNGIGTIHDKNLGFTGSKVIINDLTNNTVIKALSESRFIPFFQPYVDSLNGNFIGVEALARLRISDRIYTPNLFLRKIHNLNLGFKLFKCLLIKSIHAIQELDSYNKKLNLSINISPSYFRDNDVSREILATLMSYKFDPCRLTIEITEEDNEYCEYSLKTAILNLRLAGVNIAIDDFGIGLSSFKRLIEYPFTNIKIDKWFVKETKHSFKCKKSLEYIIAMAKELDLDITAEGIECLDDVTRFKDLGVSYLQGHYYSKALPYIDLTKLLLSKHN